MTEKFDYSEVGDLVSSPFVRPPQSPGYEKNDELLRNEKILMTQKKVLSVSSHLLDGKTIDPKPATPKNK